MARFLIVDDDPAVSEMFGRMLQGEGHQVEASASAEAGLASVAIQRPDAILLDVRMPLVGGVEFLRRLRADPATRTLPVGVITGDYFLKEDTLAELDSLGAEVRYKPLWMADVLALAAALLDRRPAGADAGASAERAR